MYNNIFSGGFSASNGWLSGGSTSSTGGFTFGNTIPNSGFDWASSMGSLSAIGGGSGGEALLDTLGTSLGAAFGSPAIGKMITGIVSDFKINGHSISENLNNVFKYGLDSWGAASNPTKSQKEFEEYKQKMLGWITGINPENIQSVFNELEHYSKWRLMYSTKSLARRSWAGSTRAAKKLKVKLITAFRKDVIAKLREEFTKKGIEFKVVKTVTESFTDKITEYASSGWNGDSSGARKNGTFTYNVYTVTASKALLAKVSKQNSKKIEPGVPPIPTVKNKSNTTMYLIIGAVLIALFGKNIKKHLK